MKSKITPILNIISKKSHKNAFVSFPSLKESKLCSLVMIYIYLKLKNIFKVHMTRRSKIPRINEIKINENISI